MDKAKNEYVSREECYVKSERKINSKTIKKINREDYYLAGIGKSLLDTTINDVGNSQIESILGEKYNSRIIYNDFLENYNLFLNQGKGYIFTGQKGNGKSSLAALIAMATIDIFDNVNVTFLDWNQYQKKYFFNTFYKKPIDVQMRAKNWIEKNVENADLLIIDDLGKNKTKDNEKVIQHLTDIMRYRYTNLLPTIITMNLNYKKFLNIYDDEYQRVSNSIKGRNTILKFTDYSYRDQEYKKQLKDEKRRLQKQREKLKGKDGNKNG